MFSWCQLDKPREMEPLLAEKEPPTVPVLMEIVSATGLIPPKEKQGFFSRKNVTAEQLREEAERAASALDPYCIVRLGGCDDEEHRTKTIWNDPDPVWTVKTDSLCILNIPEKEEEENREEKEKDEKENDSKEEWETKEFDEMAPNPEDNCVVVEVCHGNQCLGVVSVPYEHVLRTKGEREEHPIRIRPTQSDDDLKQENEHRGILALRFRRASSEDLEFFESRNSPRGEREPIISKAADINFRHVRMPGLLQNRSKRSGGDNKEKVFRVQPYCDPEREEETTWMTSDAIFQESLKPSRKWIEAGYGTMGTVYVEIIGCDDLPNMDVGVNDLTDPFVGIIFEDTMVRSDVIHNCLDPRWMPWCTRAFAFNIVHPSSLLLVGVFDYDDSSLLDHDPVGRVVINLANFESDTSYLLHYALHDDPQENDDRGKIIIRLRVEWRNEKEAVKEAALTLPPRFLINVETPKAFKVLRYLCKGKVNMQKASVASVKIYANELVTHFKAYLYVVDVIIGVLLWRGRARFSIPFVKSSNETGAKTFCIWFPLQSMALFAAAALAVERPTLIPSIFFYGIAWIMLSINYYGSNCPNPWKRCKSVRKRNLVFFLGDRWKSPVIIEPNEGVKEGEAYDALDRVKAQRVAGFLKDFKTVALKAKRTYSKSQVNNIAIETEDKSGFAFIENNLYYLHFMLYMMCTYIRMLRNLVTWRSHSSQRLTTFCIAAGTLYSFPRLILPMDYILHWIARIAVWMFFGPWMKLLDIYYVHPYYRTREELMEDPEFHGTNLEAVLESEKLQELGKSARIAAEDSRKLKDMREHRFGKLSELVPAHDTSRYPDIPLPDSTAQPYLGPDASNEETEGFVDVPVEEQCWKSVLGQKLDGDMIPQRKQAVMKRSEITTSMLGSV